MFSFRTTSLEEQLDRALLDGKVACFCTQNCWDISGGRYMYELFSGRGNLYKLFLPHGAELTPDTNHIVYDKEVLYEVGAVVVEIQDVGVRYFNFTSDVLNLMKDLTEMKGSAPALYIVDHMNPAGRIVEGAMPLEDDDVFRIKVPVRHGLTLGELTHLYYNQLGAKFPLHVISAFASSSNKQLLPWTIAPASDIPGMFTCYMYSGGGLWNHTTISPGIGTPRPYEYIGAPFIEHSGIDVLPAPEGVVIRPCSFTPAAGIYSGRRCNGYQIMLLPGYEYHSLLHTMQLMRYFAERYPEFALKQDFRKKLSDDVLISYIMGECSYRDMQEHVKTEEQKWIRKAKKFALYDDFPVRIK